jgi:trans-aconitate 2-methyltransferase
MLCCSPGTSLADVLVWLSDHTAPGEKSYASEFDSQRLDTSTIQVVPDWDPEQYRRFAAERAQPFHDLLGLIEPGGVRRAVDLGCGPGELTALAAERLGADDMLGIDNSRAMLEKAREHASDHVRFEFGDIAEWTSAADVDVVIAAASLQWVPDHAGVIKRWAAALRPAGQIAIQVPANANGATHVVARELAARSPYVELFGDDGPPLDPVQAYVLEPEEYAQILYDLGFARQHVRLQVYPHVLPSTRHVVEWVRGTTLTRFEKVLPAEAYASFVADYERELLGVLGNHEPHFFPFRRILMWAARVSR